MNLRMIRFMACPFTLLLSACSLFGGESYSETKPPEGAVERRVTRTPEEVSKATTEAIQELGMTVESDQHDALGGQLLAERATPDKDKVIVWYKSVDPRSTKIAVKVGSGDTHLADLVQDHIAIHLGTGAAMVVPSVGAVAEGQYDQPVPQCTAALERALRNLKMDGIRSEMHDTWSLVNSRESDAIPVEARIERTMKDKTRVRIIAGSTQNQDNQVLADRVKAAFEQELGQSSAK